MLADCDFVDAGSTFSASDTHSFYQGDPLLWEPVLMSTTRREQMWNSVPCPVPPTRENEFVLDVPIGAWIGRSRISMETIPTSEDQSSLVELMAQLGSGASAAAEGFPPRVLWNMQPVQWQEASPRSGEMPPLHSFPVLAT